MIAINDKAPDFELQSDSGDEYIVKGHDPYQVSFYSLGTPALADGKVFYGSYNGRVYSFGTGPVSCGQ